MTKPSAAPAYPDAPRLDLVDDFHGTPVPDPYRWLEDQQSPETRAWLQGQIGYTRSFVDAVPQRAAIVVLTDGIANAGITGPDAIVADAQRRSEGTIDISTIGVGQNLDVPLLQRLAAGARGLFHFVADGQDVRVAAAAKASASRGSRPQAGPWSPGECPYWRSWRS